jgi:lipopolysaccharide transport system ATP-binding protein
MGIIEISGISKRYLRARPDAKLSTLGEALGDTLRHPLRHLRRTMAKPTGDNFFWALRDVNLQVEQGDVVGVIGSNGAGKSTLLKVLSRITEPTAGHVVLRGRIASLLEVGTGFHPELTGRENIFLNGAMLGMKKHEIRSKFDEIVAFSEIERFLETPVKRYSSGMYVRLAFAVAAHLEPEILVVDEVLAVGDITFQRKCLGKMGEVSRQGRTVLFVSHNMAAIENLCNRGVVLEHGRVIFEGRTNEAIQEYVRGAQTSGRDSTSDVIDLRSARRKSSEHRSLITTLHVQTDNNEPVRGGVQIGASLVLRLLFRLEKPDLVGGGFAVENLLGQRIFLAHTTFCEPLYAAGEGSYCLTCRIPSLALCPGQYRINLGILLGGVEVDSIEDAYRLNVLASDFYGNGRLPPNSLIVVQQDWSLEPTV